jgi:hypothetical protein
MHLRCAMLGILAACFFVARVHPQASVTVYGETPPADRSFYLGQPVEHPEALSGVWEAPDGHRGTVGIHLQLGTMVNGNADPPVWTPQSWQYLEVSVFERSGPELAFGDENYFGDNPRGSSVRLENGRLQMHFVSTQSEIPSVDLDLMRQADGCWHGRFHRGDFDSTVTLCRPTSDPTATSSPLVGTWSSSDGGCVHIFESGMGVFTGWSDNLQVPGRILFNSNDPKPHNLFQTYGDLVKVHLAGDGQVLLEFGAYNAMCCSYTYIGKLSVDGSILQTKLLPALNQVPHAARWSKMPGDACVDPSTLRRAQAAPCLPLKTKQIE